jgi:hypothetical protein
MLIKQARDAARQWALEEASGLPGFCGAYSSGSTNWLPDTAEMTTMSDLDIVVVLSDTNQATRRGKFIFQNVLFDVSYLRNDQLESPELVLSNYHLAPSFRTTTVLLDPSGHLAKLLAIVRRDYAKRHWVRNRCSNAKDKVLEHLHSIQDEAPLHDQVLPWLFAAGRTTHLLLTAGLKNPTVRQRYMAVRELLADYGYLKFHEELLELLGSARISHERVSHHVETLTDIFEVAKNNIKTAFPFAADISGSARAIAIDGSLELLKRGCHREAMFWIAVTHSRCQKVILCDAPEQMTQSFRDSYLELAGDLGVPSSLGVRRRCAEVELILPRVWDLAETIIGLNQDIQDD